MANSKISTHPDPLPRPKDSGSLYLQAAYDERYTDRNTGEQRIRHHAAVYVGSISIVDPRTGKRQRRKITGTIPEKVSAKLRNLTKAKHREELPTGSRKTLDWLMAQWLASPVAAEWDASTHDYYAANSRLHVVPKLGQLTLKQLDSLETKNTVQAWVNDLKKRLAPKTVRHAHATLSGAINWAMAPEQRYLTRSACRGVKLPAVGEYNKPLIEPEDFAKFQQAAQGHRLAAAFALLFSRGLRPGEVLAICWPDIDLDRGTLTLQHSMEWIRPERDAQGNRVVGSDGKPLPGRINIKDTLKTAGSAVTLHLESGEVAAFKARRKLQVAERLKAGSLWKDCGHDLVFTTRYGSPFHSKDIYDAFQRVLRASGFKGRTNPYGMRHGGISEVAARYGLKAAQKFARHAHMSTTADRYIDVADRYMQEVSRGMGGLVSG